MSSKKYSTIEDLQSIVSNDLREGISLEYKNSSILSSKTASTAISKAVSAFGNSMGGQFITGVESRDERPIRLDGGITGESKIDWFHQVINSNTFPALENFEVREIADGKNLYYVVDVPLSISAPHQSNDNKYYKRRGPHSDPMEHYEIEDIRNRPKIKNAPLQVEIVSDDFLVLLRLSNNDKSNQVENLKFQISTNFQLNSHSIDALNSRGLKQIASASSLPFLLDSFYTILQANSEAEIFVEIDYEYKSQSIRYKKSFCIGDYAGTLIVRSPIVRSMEAMTEKIGKLIDSLGSLKQIAELLEQSIDGSGVRVSKRTLSALKEIPSFFDPIEFNYKGYMIVADVTLDEAINLHGIFHSIGNGRSRHQHYMKVPEDVRQKFEKAFKVKFEDGPD